MLNSNTNPAHDAHNGIAPNPEPLNDPEIELLAMFRHCKGIIAPICLQEHRLTSEDFADPAAGAIYGAALMVVDSLGIASATDVIAILDIWTRQNSEKAPLAVAGLQLWDALEKPDTAPDDAKAWALELARRIRERDASTRKVKSAFELYTLRDMAAIPRPRWLVRGLLVEKTASVISADSGCFKSFFALDMALCVALGRPFMDKEVKQGAAVYVAAEGFFTIADRAQAFAQHHGCELPENFHALKVPVNLGDAATVAAFGAAIENLAPAIVVLDTLSQCAIGANENDNGQMADFLRGMMALCERIGAHVTVLHHNGKSSGAFRGAGAIKANADAHISLDRPENDEENTVFVRCEKQRGRPFEPFALRGVEILLPFTDEYGDDVTSLVFESCGDAVAPKAKDARAEKSDKTRAALMEVFDRCAVAGADFGGVKVGFWKEAVEECKPPICAERQFWKYRKALEADGTIEESGTHNGSPVFQRKTPVLRVTAPTAPTALLQKCSSAVTPNSAAPEVLHCTAPYVVSAVGAVPSAVTGSALNAAPGEKPRKTKRKPKNDAASEPYRAPESAADESEVF